MNFMMILGSILILSIVLFLGNCIAYGTDSKDVSVQMDIPVSIGFTSPPPASLSLNPRAVGDYTNLFANTYVVFNSNNADGYQLAAAMTEDGGYLTTSQGTSLSSPLQISLPNPDDSDSPDPSHYNNATYTSLDGGAIQNYSPGTHHGYIFFKQLVDPTKEGGFFTGDVTITLSLPFDG